MRIIDLLNKIANREEVPEKIEYDKKTYHYVKMWQQYIDDNDIPLLRHVSNFNYSGLNDEIISIEEPEEIDIQEIDEIDLFDNGRGYNDIETVKNAYDNNFGHITDTINDLIKAVKKLDNLLRPKQINTDYRGMDKIAEEICREE